MDQATLEIVVRLVVVPTELDQEFVPEEATKYAAEFVKAGLYEMFSAGLDSPLNYAVAEIHWSQPEFVNEEDD